MTSVLLEHEVVDAMLPRKASKLQVTRNRTPNRHRWLGREYHDREEITVHVRRMWGAIPGRRDERELNRRMQLKNSNNS